MKRIWLNLFMSPIWFLIAIGTIHWGKNSDESFYALFPTYIQKYGSYILLFMLVCIGLHLFWSAHQNKFNLFRNGWRSQNNIMIEIGGGVAMGCIMAIFYFAFVAPFQITLQNYFGDYVNTGESAAVFSHQPLIYFIANVLLAPFIHESLFRNYAIKKLRPQFNITSRILLTSIGFGLFHCMGGFWYMVMNCFLVGVPFAFVAEKRNNIIWTFAAHTTLNILEVIYFAF